MEKIEALAKFLGIEDLEQIEETRYDTFQVNPHTKKLGSSVSELTKRVELVKQALEVTGVTKILDFNTSASFVPGVYNALSKMFYKHCNELTKIGIHDLINTTYYLCKGSKDTSLDSKSLEFSAQYADLFDGKEIEDNREEIEVSDGEYMVLDDSEAEDKYTESLQSYVEECVLSEIPENLQKYFDTDAYINDCMTDGRGSALASYDGEENEEGEYFIYRVG